MILELGFSRSQVHFSLTSMMNVIPVMDILNGQVVHAVGGERSHYKPIESILTKSAEPIEVASAFKKAGFGEIYIADLDAIIDCTNHSFNLLKKISQITGVSLIVDAGITSIDRAKMLLDAGISKIVVGTETLQSKTFVKAAVDHFGAERLIVSLDLKDGKVLVAEGYGGCTDAFCMLKEFKDMGVEQVILLDLSRVGSDKGVDIQFLRKVKLEFGFEVYAGGGVRNIWDLVELQENCLSGALVATALHTGKFSVGDLKTAGFL